MKMNYLAVPAFAAALALIASGASAQIVVDGVVEAEYGAALASDDVLPTAGEGGESGNPVVDLADLFVANDATDLFVAVTIAADISGGNDWGKYAVYINSPGLPAPTANDNWGRAVAGSSNFQFHSWVDGGGGAGFNVWDGVAFQNAAVDTDFAFATAATSVVEFSVPLATLNVVQDDIIQINAWVTGGGGGDNAQDGIPSTIANATDWGTTSDLTPMVNYTIQPPPSSISDWMILE